MGDFQSDVLDKIAQVVGGAVSAADPHFFSGAGGIAGIAGCYSVPPENVDKMPLGIVLLDQFTSVLASIGEEDNDDQIRLLLLVAPYRIEAEMSKLTPFRDTVPAGFRAHTQLFSAPSTLSAFVVSGRGGVHQWRGNPYLAYEFTIHVSRMLDVSYTP